MLFEIAFLTDFESGPFVADLLSIYIHVIIALCFINLKSVLIIPYFFNSSGANAAKTYLSYFGEDMMFGGLFLLHKDGPGCSFTLGWGLLTLLRRVCARTKCSGEERSCSGGESRTHVHVAASCVPLPLLLGTEIECACVLVVSQTQDI